MHDLFVSYSSKNKQLADALVHYLESNKIRCWIAPRDIPAGAEYGDAIDAAIDAARFVVVVISDESVNSRWVKSEVNLAMSSGKIIIPFRIRDIILHGAMRFYLNDKHWIDAFPRPEEYFSILKESICRLSGVSEGSPEKWGHVDCVTDLIQGRYRLVRQLGGGRDASVLLARDEMLDGRLVAIKLLPDDLCDAEVVQSLFRQFAMQVLPLSHSNMVTYRSFEKNNDVQFVVLDFVGGLSLRDYLREKGGRIEEPEVLRIMRPVAEVLDYLHGNNLVFGEFKPESVMISPDGEPCVVDLGLGYRISHWRKLVENIPRESASQKLPKILPRILPGLGAVIGVPGTISYQSPERVMNDPISAKDDVFSFAMVCIECLTGTVPFGAMDNVFPRIISNPRSRLLKALHRGLVRDPDKRPHSCVELIKVRHRHWWNPFE